MVQMEDVEVFEDDNFHVAVQKLFTDETGADTGIPVEIELTHELENYENVVELKEEWLTEDTTEKFLTDHYFDSQEEIELEESQNLLKVWNTDDEDVDMISAENKPRVHHKNIDNEQDLPR